MKIAERGSREHTAEWREIRQQRPKAMRAFEALERAKCELFSCMSTEDGRPLISRLGVMADECEHYQRELVDKYGVLVQVHGFRDGHREMISQRPFLEMRDVPHWTKDIEESYSEEYDGPFEIHTEDSEHFFVQV